MTLEELKSCSLQKEASDLKPSFIVGLFHLLLTQLHCQVCE